MSDGDDPSVWDRVEGAASDTWHAAEHTAEGVGQWSEGAAQVTHFETDAVVSAALDLVGADHAAESWHQSSDEAAVDAGDHFRQSDADFADAGADMWSVGDRVFAEGGSSGPSSGTQDRPADDGTSGEAPDAPDYGYYEQPLAE